MAGFDDQTELIKALFASASKSGPNEAWSAFLAVLRSITQADGAVLCIEADKAAVFGTGPTVEAELRTRLRVDRVYDQDTLPYFEWRHGYLRAVKVRIDQTMTASLWITRGRHSKDFRSVDGQLLSSLTPFLGQAAAMWQSLETERCRAVLMSKVAECSGIGWIIFERSGLIGGYSEAVSKWSEDLGLRLVDRRRLELVADEAAQSFRTAFQSILAGSPREVAVLGVEPLVELILTPLPDNLVLGSFRFCTPASVVPSEMVAAHFSISKSEARLAMQLCDGANIKEAAVNLGWTEETTRSTTKAIFARLGISGQPALVRRIMGSGLWLGR